MILYIYIQYTSSDFVNRDGLFGLLKWARSERPLHILATLNQRVVPDAETSGMDWGIIEK